MPIPNMNKKSLSVDTPMPPPTWALLERELIRAQTIACEAFFDRYFDERGYLICLPRWGGNDGPDDAIENLTGAGHSCIHLVPPIASCRCISTHGRGIYANIQKRKQ